MAEKKLVSFRFPEPLISELKHRAAEEGVSMTELIMRFSKQGLEVSTEERLMVLEDKLQQLRGSAPFWQDQSCRGPDIPDVNVQFQGMGQPVSSVPSPHLHRMTQVQQLQQRLDQLSRCIQKDMADIAGEVRRLQVHLDFEAPMQ
jgi:hypothetical protein